MVDLSTKFLGVNFKNPIVAAAGTITRLPQNAQSCIRAGVGGVVLKSTAAGHSGLERTVDLNPMRNSHHFLDKFGFPGALAHADFIFETRDEVIRNVEQVKPLAEKEGVVLIGSFCCLGPVEEQVILDRTKALEAAGADIVEISVSCPAMPPAEREAKTVELARDVHKHVKGKLGIPFYIKVGYPGLASWLERVKAVVDGGGKAIGTEHDIGTTWLDIETGKPICPNPKLQGHFAVAINSYAAALAAQANLQVVGGGGVWTWRDAVQLIMCGASLTYAHTAVLYHGYKRLTEIRDGLAQFMERKGYTRLDEFRGIAAPLVSNPSSMMKEWMTTRVVPKESVRITVDEAKCNGCGKCTVCWQNAIALKEDIARIDLKLCQRCGVCASICPTDAIALQIK